jgi:hypothetical protein
MSLYEAITVYLTGAVTGVLVTLFAHNGEFFKAWVERLERESEDEE